MELKINCTFKNEKKEIQRLVITEADIEELIVQKAKHMRISGYKGRYLTHYDECIESVQLIN